MTQLYCKCQHCDQFFEVTKRRKYCTTSCRDKAYRKRKKL